MIAHSLPPSLERQAYLSKLNRAIERTQERRAAQIVVPPDIVEWAHDNFYVAETKRPIALQPVQQAVLRAFFQMTPDGRFQYTSGLYSTIKKSGKTTIAALFLQWAVETWGERLEFYHMGNKLSQAQERAFKLMRYSIELSPRHNDWEITATKLTHLSTGNYLKALPMNAAGEAGGNQAATAWTEIHGYTYESDVRMWEEMQPVPTQRLSFRFAESYAGYEGESLLLKRIWDRALDGERVHDDYPIYTNGSLIAYIDTGPEARRMPWQTPDYYANAEAESTPSEYRRLHLNEWVSSENKFVPDAWWDACYGEPPPLTRNEPVVFAIDAAVTSDYFAIVGVSRRDDVSYVRYVRVWQPPKNGEIDFADIERTIIDLCQQYNVVQIAYDPHEMAGTVQRLRNEVNTWFYGFDQGKARLIADKGLYDAIRDRRLLHTGDDALTTAIQNANAKTDGEDSKLRIVKRSEALKIDATVALSMAVDRANYLTIG